MRKAYFFSYAFNVERKPNTLLIFFLLTFFSSFLPQGLKAQNTFADTLQIRIKNSIDKSRNNSTILKTDASIACTGFTLEPANATTNSLTQIIQSLVGSGVSISNVQTTLPATSDIYGSFSCGSGVVGIEQGLVLTTGSISNVRGPNSSTSASRNNSLPGNRLLRSLSSGTGFDAAAVSFDITPTANTLTFNYVFASEEYNNYVGSSFNDVFGLFIGGSRVTGDINLALLPGTSTPVSINNVNKGIAPSTPAANPEFFINNDDRTLPFVPQPPDPLRYANLEYDGLTVRLTATIRVIPGQEYTLTFAIQDIGDGSLDSGVFIEAGSLTSTNVYYSKSTGDLNSVLTWGVNPDGSGDSPTDFGTGTFNLANRPAEYSMTNDWTVGGIINFESGSQLQINGFTLSEAGLSGAGTITGSQTSNLVVTGSTPHTLNFTLGNINFRTLNNLTLSRTNSGAVVALGLGEPLNILNVLSINTGTLSTNNALTLKSTSTNTARVAPISATGAITGNVTVERYIPPRRAWRILSAPVANLSGGASGSASLANAQENPPVIPTTTLGSPRPASFGTAVFSLNNERTALTFTATINNIDFTGSQTADVNDNLIAAHIHAGPSVTTASNGPVVWGFFGSPQNDNMPYDVVKTPFTKGVGGTISGKWDAAEGNGTTLTAQLKNLLSGRAYINFHTVQFSGGEIRGAINLIPTGSQTINQAWQEGATTASANPNPGFGTHVTHGSTNGFDFNPVDTMFSIKRYISTTDTWQPLSNTDATSVGTQAYMLFVRGDRSIPLSYNTVPPTPTTLRAKGGLNIGDQTIPVSSTGFTAIPNPFASPINFATITKNNVQNFFYAWDPKMGGVNGVGAYVLVNFNGTSYNVTPTPVSPISEIIQSGQGFMVRSTGVAGSLVIKESDKSATPAMDVFRMQSDGEGNRNNNEIRNASDIQQGLKVNLLVINNNTVDLLDGVYTVYNNKFSSKIDDFDAVKLYNVNENLALVRDNETLMLERRAVISTIDTIRLKLWNTERRKYVFEFNPIDLSSIAKSALLIDNYLHTSTPVSISEISKVSFTINADAASANPGRFMLALSTVSSPFDIVTRSGKKTISSYPNPIGGKTINIQMVNQPAGAYWTELINNLGQVVYKGRISHSGGSTIQTLRLNNTLQKGLYQLRITQKNETTTLKIIAN